MTVAPKTIGPARLTRKGREFLEALERLPVPAVLKPAARGKSTAPLVVAPARAPVASHGPSPYATHEEFEATDTGCVIMRLYRSNGELLATRQLIALEEADQFLDRFATAAAEARAALRQPGYARRG